MSFIMNFLETDIPGVLKIELLPNRDDRGWFARSWCQHEFEEHGLDPRIAQCNVSFNDRKGTLRGLHYQDQPFPEAKVVRCTSGAIYDVVVDLRPESSAFLKWLCVELTAGNRHALYVPGGCAHGFLTLADESEVLYLMSEFYHPELARGVRWNDPAFGVVWPAAVEVISERDRTYPDFR
jgi:dTDP-4-dehydrorhamnose 3,5-epimerase